MVDQEKFDEQVKEIVGCLNDSLFDLQEKKCERDGVNFIQGAMLSAVSDLLNSLGMTISQNEEEFKKFLRTRKGSEEGDAVLLDVYRKMSFLRKSHPHEEHDGK